MRRFLGFALAAVALVGACSGGSPTGAAQGGGGGTSARLARPAAVFGVTYGGGDIADGSRFLVVTGAHVPGKGWRGDAVAGKLAAKGTRFACFTPTARLTGQPVRAEKAAEVGAVGEWGLTLEDAPSLRTVPVEKAGSRTPLLAVANGPAAAQPRRPKAESNDAAPYRRAVAELLRTQGKLRVSSPRLTQNLRVDLDGDGTEEVLLAANSPDTLGGEGLPKDGYTAVVLRHVGPGGKVRTVPLGLSTANIEDSYSLTQRVLAVADIDGDGRMEVVTYATHYESESFAVWTFDGKAARKVVETHWGA